MHIYRFTDLLEDVSPERLLNGFLTTLGEEKNTNKNFNENAYVWIIGANVFNRLRNLSHMYGNLWDREKNKFLDISIIVRFVYTNPNSIVLDKKIFVDEVPNRLVCDISTGYAYVDTDSAMAVNELKMELNKQYGCLSMQSSKKEEKRMNTSPLNPEYAYAAHDAINMYKTFKAYEAYKNAHIKPEDPIKKAIFNDPATIVYWKDGTKTIVMAKNEPFDPEKGLAMAFTKKFLGNKGNYYDIFRKWLPEEKPEEQASEETDACLVELLTSKQLAEKLRLSISTVLRDCRRGLYPGAQKVDGKWLIPYSGLVGGSKNDN